MRHLAAMPYGELPTFMGELHQREGVAARALEFCILTAASTSEVLQAKWDEIDTRWKPPTPEQEYEWYRGSTKA